MKKVALALALAVALPSMAFAADSADAPTPPPAPFEHGKPGDHGPGGKHGPHDGKFQRDLGLTKDQSKAARKEFGEGMRDRFEITKKYLDKLPKADQEAMQAELKKSEQKHREAFLKLLTPEQKVKAEAFEKAHLEHRKGDDKAPVAK
ncbi:LTXXQ domain protein [Pseudomonas putida]|uniref:LTXXQ domain protein n=1 Tax=Pseudomonas putida TaxID=303 RepID=A0A8I1JJJ2_PSEPU|nr:LTXXQ domain protein [Pseudomonas putida]MBI6882430.1 LTXXQ domain protein [Pseudomonas putida]